MAGDDWGGSPAHRLASGPVPIRFVVFHAHFLLSACRRAAGFAGRMARPHHPLRHVAAEKQRQAWSPASRFFGILFFALRPEKQKKARYPASRDVPRTLCRPLSHGQDLMLS